MDTDIASSEEEPQAPALTSGQLAEVRAYREHKVAAQADYELSMAGAKAKLKREKEDAAERFAALAASRGALQRANRDANRAKFAAENTPEARAAKRAAIALKYGWAARQ